MWLGVAVREIGRLRGSTVRRRRQPSSRWGQTRTAEHACQAEETLTLRPLPLGCKVTSTRSNVDARATGWGPGSPKGLPMMCGGRVGAGRCGGVYPRVRGCGFQVGHGTCMPCVRFISVDILACTTWGVLPAKSSVYVMRSIAVHRSARRPTSAGAQQAEDAHHNRCSSSSPFQLQLTHMDSAL